MRICLQHILRPQEDSLKKIKDLKGKKIAINAYSSAVDLELRVVLKKNGLDPKSDVEIVEVTFPNMGPALREKRVDCAVMVLPFMAVEENQRRHPAAVHGHRCLPTLLGRVHGRAQ